MTRRDFAVVKRIFLAAGKLEGRERQAYLRQACRRPDLLKEVKSLLAHHSDDETFLGIYSSIGNKLLGHYDIRERLGEGGMAIVYKARDLRLGRWVALKVLQPWLIGRPESQARLVQEARHASALNHPHIVTVHDVDQENGMCFIVMEHVPGEPLDRLIPHHGFALLKALHYAAQITDALSAAHASGIAHGDLKPGNIVITKGDHIKLLDFGLANALDTGRHSSKRVHDRFGTKAYMAPELLNDRRLRPTPKSDIFSFGLLMQEMLTGRHAFGSGTANNVAFAIQHNAARDLPAKVPAPLASITRRCLEKNPRRRLPSMRELAVALGKIRRELEDRHGQQQEAMPELASKRGVARRPPRPGSNPGMILQIRTTLERIGYQNIAKSRQALTELESFLKGDASRKARDLVIPGLKDVITTIPDFGGGPVPGGVRAMRRAALDLLNLASEGELGRCFANPELEFLDLYGMNFAAQRLGGKSFRECFLVESTFQDSDLKGACFAMARLSNANYSGANVVGADFTGADWFNALGFNERQLAGVRRETLLPCPPTEKALHFYLSAHYVFPFDSWSTVVQERLKATWEEYLRPGGLKDFVAKQRVTQAIESSEKNPN